MDPLNSASSLQAPEFTKATGGEYFFVPSISALGNKIAA